MHIYCKRLRVRLGSRAGPQKGRKEGLKQRGVSGCVGGSGLPGQARGVGPTKNASQRSGMGGRVGLRGRRPDAGLLVPNASRQEAEANQSSRDCLCRWSLEKTWSSKDAILTLVSLRRAPQPRAIEVAVGS